MDNQCDGTQYASDPVALQLILYVSASCFWKGLAQAGGWQIAGGHVIQGAL